MYFCSNASQINWKAYGYHMLLHTHVDLDTCVYSLSEFSLHMIKFFLGLSVWSYYEDRHWCSLRNREVPSPVGGRSGLLETKKAGKHSPKNPKTAIKFLQKRNKSPHWKSLGSRALGSLCYLIFLRLNLFYLPNFFLQIHSPLFIAELFVNWLNRPLAMWSYKKTYFEVTFRLPLSEFSFSFV